MSGIFKQLLTLLIITSFFGHTGALARDKQNDPRIQARTRIQQRIIFPSKAHSISGRNTNASPVVPPLRKAIPQRLSPQLKPTPNNTVVSRRNIVPLPPRFSVQRKPILPLPQRNQISHRLTQRVGVRAPVGVSLGVARPTPPKLIPSPLTRRSLHRAVSLTASPSRHSELTLPSSSLIRSHSAAHIIPHRSPVLPLQASTTSSPRPVFVLSLDGGGVRGRGTARALQDMEADVQRATSNPSLRLFDMFDSFAGTSTGGLLALMLATKRPVEECLTLYRSHTQRIFSRSYWHQATSLNGVLGPKYNVKAGLSPLLKETLGDTLLHNAQKPVFVTAYEPARSKVHLLDSVEARDPSSRFHSLKARHAARATSAAPTYFAAKRIKCRANNSSYTVTLVDGGVAVNNPAHLAVERAKQLFPGRPCIVISVGTGHEHTPLAEPRGGLWHFGPSVVNHLMSGATAATHRGLRLSLPAGHYHRLQFESNLPLDATDPTQLQQLETAAGTLRHTPAFKNAVNCLASHLTITQARN